MFYINDIANQVRGLPKQTSAQLPATGILKPGGFPIASGSLDSPHLGSCWPLATGLVTGAPSGPLLATAQQENFEMFNVYYIVCNDSFLCNI